MQPFPWKRAVAWSALAVVLCACSPALNWRNVILGSVRFTLPCKPDQAQRDVVLAGVSRALDMRGCEADGALFAISRIALAPSDDATAVVHAWRTAALTALQAPPSAVEDLALPNYRRVPDARAMGLVQAQGRQPQGAAVQAQLAWFVVGRELFHLAVYAPRLMPGAVAPMMTDIETPR